MLVENNKRRMKVQLFIAIVIFAVAIAVAAIPIVKGLDRLEYTYEKRWKYFGLIATGFILGIGGVVGGILYIS